MSDRISLCIIRIEMEDDVQHKSDEEVQVQAGGGVEDNRKPQKISVETYANKLMEGQDIRLLPASSREGSQAPAEPEAVSSGPREETNASTNCEEVDFCFGNPLVEITKGILHLYKENELTDASVEAPSRTLCLLAVPASVSCRDLLGFTAACQRDIQHVRILRDAAPDRYMALLTFRSRGAAYEFRETFGGTAYSSLEPGSVCHAAWVRRVECVRGAMQPPPSATELPTCPVCLERMDESVEGLLTVQCAHSFHTGCLGGWSDGTCPVCRCAQSPDPPAASECSECIAQGISEEGGALWICLICGHIGCGRYQAGHAAQHFRLSNHTYAMQLGTNCVWDYAGDNFVHRLLQNKSDGKLVASGGPADPDVCAPASQEKIDSLQLECAHLLTTQLDAQRRRYEELLAKEKENAEKESKELKEKLQNSEKNMAQLNKKLQNLSAKLSVIQSKLTEEKAVAESAVLAREELNTRCKTNEIEIADLKEQIRDLAFYVEASNAIGKQGEFNELQGGNAFLGTGTSGGGRAKGRRPKHK